MVYLHNGMACRYGVNVCHIALDVSDMHLRRIDVRLNAAKKDKDQVVKFVAK